MLFVNTFEYDGIKSAKYGLFFGHVNTERLKQICGNLEYNQVYYPSLNRQEIHGINKDEFPLSFDLEIISAEPISYWYAKEIKKWLFNSPTYKKLYASRIKDKTIEKINGEEKRRYVECIFTNPEAMFYADGLHGWKCTCTLSSGWAFQDEIEITYTDFTDNITATVKRADGIYYRIGDLVYISCDSVFVVTDGGTGWATIKGLPFVSRDSASMVVSEACGGLTYGESFNYVSYGDSSTILLDKRCYVYGAPNSNVDGGTGNRRYSRWYDQT